MKAWFTAKDLAGIGGLSKHPSNVTRLAKREKWEYRQKEGVKGGGFEYAMSSLPEKVQSALKKKVIASLLPKTQPTKNNDLEHLTQNQRAIADARMAIIAYVQQLEQLQPRYIAIKYFCDQAKAGELPEHVQSLIKVANARNKNGKSERTLSPRTLNQWVLDYEKCKTPAERLQCSDPLN